MHTGQQKYLGFTLCKVAWEVVDGGENIIVSPSARLHGGLLKVAVAVLLNGV
jgi:hypothetical protein